VDESEVRQWVAEGTLTHYGMVRDVAPLLKTMHVFVLPTWYREGVPHATLEALATGRPVITTNSVGARECVKLTAEGETQRENGEMLMQGENGFLCQPQNIAAVECAMEWYLANPAQIAAQGQGSRQLAADVFDVRLVNEIIIRAMRLQKAVRGEFAVHSSLALPHSSF
jgi:glycosyltransferase involved in cell wall biosynthesis